MEYEEFLSEVKGLGINIHEPPPPPKPKPPRKNASTKPKKPSWRNNIKPLPVFSDPVHISIKWVTGGTTGGSWRGEDSHHPRESEEKPDFESLDAILLKFCPNIGYLQYKIIYSLRKTSSYDEYEYYGNSTVWGIEKIYLEDLFNKMVELKLI